MKYLMQKTDYGNFLCILQLKRSSLWLGDKYCCSGDDPVVLGHLKMFITCGAQSYGVSSVWIRQKRSKILPSESFCYLYVEGHVYAFVKQFISSESAGKYRNE